MKKTHNNYKKKLIHSNNLLKYGQIGLKIINFKSISKNQFLALTNLLIKKLKKILQRKKIKTWNTLNFNKNLTKLNLESRMGKGKGPIYKQTVFLKPGNILLEIDNLKGKEINELNIYLKKTFFIKTLLIQKYNN